MDKKTKERNKRLLKYIWEFRKQSDVTPSDFMPIKMMVLLVRNF